MQLQQLTYLLQNPEAVTASQTDALLSKINDHPYFQALHALYLKGLKQKESYKYNNALKVTAAHTADRSVLFDYITSEVFSQNEISLQIKQNSESIKSMEIKDFDDISVNKSVTIDDALNEHINANKDVLDPELFEAKPIQHQIQPNIETTTKQIDTKTISPEKKLNIGAPLEFDKSENHSFAEWLKLTRFKPILRKDEESNTEDNYEKPELQQQNSTPPLSDKLEMIDRFISENPKIKPVKNHPKPKLVNNDDELSDSLMTETLARIYLEQKNYDKAIQSYKILSLKYPEKSGFFADQIKAVKELKEHNNI